MNKPAAGKAIRGRDTKGETTMAIHLQIGKTVITPGALKTLDLSEIPRALAQHGRGDWGDVPEEHWKENDLAVAQGFRVLSSYHDYFGNEFWIITEADRSATTIMLPKEY